MQVYWFEQTAADVPRVSDWLSPAESARLEALRFARRRADWLLGRWAAKQALSRCLSISRFREIEVSAAPSGAPEVFVAGRAAPVRISLSHRAGTAVCAVTGSQCALGCDLEAVEPHSEAFVADFFTPEEQELVARAPADRQLHLVNLLWSGKESALKALRCGLRMDTREVAVTAQNVTFDAALPSDAAWRPLEVRYASTQIFRGWWRHSGALLRTVVVSPPSAPPVMLGV